MGVATLVLAFTTNMVYMRSGPSSCGGEASRGRWRRPCSFDPCGAAKRSARQIRFVSALGEGQWARVRLVEPLGRRHMLELIVEESRKLLDEALRELAYPHAAKHCRSSGVITKLQMPPKQPH